MRTFIFFALVMSLVFYACNKAGNSTTTPTPSTYYIKATIDGTDFIYSNYTAAVSQYPENLYIYGYNSSAIASDDGISIYVTKQSSSGIEDSVTVGTYTDTANINYSINHVWNQYWGRIILQQSGKDWMGNKTRDTLPPFTPIICTITAIDSVSVTGTFSGPVFYGANSDSPYKILTNGSFYVPR